MTASECVVAPLVVGQLAENCYLFADKDEKEAIIIDPGDAGDYIIDALQKMQLTPIAILATHGHFDHIMAAFELQTAFSLPFLIHGEDVFLVKRMSETAKHFLGITISDPPPVITRILTDGERIACGKQTLIVVHTPGHTPGSVCFSVKGRDIVFVGDTIFADGGVGRTDFSYSRPQALSVSIKRILSFPLHTVLYSGHGEQTSVEKEKAFHL